MSPTTDRPSFMSGAILGSNSTQAEPKLFALDPMGRPVPVRLGAGLKLDVDLKTADFVLNALAPIPPPKATVVGSQAEFMADTDTFLLPLPVPNAQPKTLSGFALYRNGRRMRMGVDYRLDESNPFRIIPHDRTVLGDLWDGKDYVCADFVATY